MAPSLWAGLSDEELAIQADEWRYARDRNTSRRRYGLARWCTRMEQEALDELNGRIAAAREAARLGDQLALELPGRVAPDRR